MDFFFLMVLSKSLFTISHSDGHTIRHVVLFLYIVEVCTDIYLEIHPMVVHLIYRIYIYIYIFIITMNWTARDCHEILFFEFLTVKVHSFNKLLSNILYAPHHHGFFSYGALKKFVHDISFRWTQHLACCTVLVNIWSMYRYILGNLPDGCAFHLSYIYIYIYVHYYGALDSTWCS